MAKIEKTVSIQQLVRMYAEKVSQEEGKKITHVSHSQKFGNPNVLNIEINLAD